MVLYVILLYIVLNTKFYSLFQSCIPFISVTIEYSLITTRGISKDESHRFHFISRNKESLVRKRECLGLILIKRFT